MGTRFLCGMLACGLIVCAVPAEAQKQGERFVVMKRVEGGVLVYKAVSDKGFEDSKKAAEDKYLSDLKVWKKAKQGPQPTKPQFTKLRGVYKTAQEAQQAGKVDGDKNGWFTCWRCDGAGTFQDLGAKKPARCTVCTGRKRIKSRGWAIVEVRLGDDWSLLVVRTEMIPLIKPEGGAAAGMMKQAGKAASSFKTKALRWFPAGAYDQALQAHQKLAEAASKKKGYTRRVAQLPGFINKVAPPSQYHAKAKD